MEKYTNQHGIELKIQEKSHHLWHGKMTGFHDDVYTEFVVWQGKYIMGDGFDTVDEAREFADTIEF